MKFEYTKPPNWDKIIENFPVKWGDVICTYGDTVYSSEPIGLQKEAHEYIHTLQQTEMDKDEWWKMYLENESFRLHQELEAHKAEADWINKNIKDRNERYRSIKRLVVNLSSKMYGNMITVEEANKLIK